jgi:maltose alpha-D-glucosyltransferase/alpha-amylase
VIAKKELSRPPTEAAGALSGQKTPPSTPEKIPMWYKSGVIYEVHVRAFQDSDGDGAGDFRGLTSRLDYLRDLGVTAIWLLPFYPSPLKDDGYDISDYFDVHPMYGTLADFKVFLREAHRRGLRVITELVMNHTSDQHPWFQRARLSPPGSELRDFYVWNDSPEKYSGARIIFKDVEVSNWTWDARAGAFYWHRFFSHQPDLNFDNPAVHEEMIKVLDFWFDMGLDGMRLDAVPYLYEREGTSCENLPETHQFLKKLRRHVDEKYGDKMLLAEANQWPEDAVAYFGNGKGDECHMAFHFPLMPRLFMALRMEDRVPIVDILEQTPPLPETAQWALFLRNHDELTLEMVTDEERDYMYRMYAHVQRARLNLGIRRRLAPLVGNDRKRIELLTALLLSLPGTPVIYYGDEIGMGENIYLGDRNGVRTPMQWSADKNAGFSRANPQSLYLPINLDPENHYEAVNVEVQERNNHSLLWWMRRIIALYKRQNAFGRGSIEFLHPENRKIFTCIRLYQNEVILVVANLSRFVQPVELDLARFQSLVPVELFGRTEFPIITDKPYPLTLGPHSFYWFSLENKTDGETAGAAEVRSTLNINSDWEEIFDERHHPQLERALQHWLPTRPWFTDKSRRIKSIRLQEIIRVPLASGEKSFIVFAQLEYIQGDPEIYILYLGCAVNDAAETIARDLAPVVIARLNFAQPSQEGVLYDALVGRGLPHALLDLIASRESLDGRFGSMAAAATPEFPSILGENAATLEPSILRQEHNNSSVLFGDKAILKLFRKLDYGSNPDLEILRYFTVQKFAWSPPLAGTLEYRFKNEEPRAMAVLTALVPKAKNAWEYTLDTLGKFYERVQTLPPEQRIPPLPPASATKFSGAALPDAARHLLDTYIVSARQLGELTAAMHLALAGGSNNTNFTPEPFTPHAQRALFQSMRNLTRQNFQLLSRQLKRLPAGLQSLAQQVLQLEPEITRRFRSIYERPMDCDRIRIHGDFHLEQVLYTGKEFLIIDFEGDPSMAVSERRLKRSPLIDVAGMIGSFQYAAYAALLKQVERGTLQSAQSQPAFLWTRCWAQWVGMIYLQAYRHAVSGARFLPPNEADIQVFIDAFLLRKAVEEIGHELRERPEWLKIPLQEILDLAGEPASDTR